MVVADDAVVVEPLEEAEASVVAEAEEAAVEVSESDEVVLSVVVVVSALYPCWASSRQ